MAKRRVAIIGNPRMDDLFVKAIAAASKIPDRVPEEFQEITVGRVRESRITPRIVSRGGVARFKDTFGVCKHDGCHKIAGHGGGH